MFFVSILFCITLIWVYVRIIDDMSKTESDKSLDNKHKTLILYHYQATTISGQQLSGVINAEDIVDAIDFIQKSVLSKDIINLKIWPQNNVQQEDLKE